MTKSAMKEAPDNKALINVLGHIVRSYMCNILNTTYVIYLILYIAHDLNLFKKINSRKS